MESQSYRFPKADRLHHRSLVEGLFRLGKSFYEFPFRVTWRKLSYDDLEKNFCSHVPAEIGKVQMMVTVPKKKRRRAVDRVKMRRLIRESYRLNRQELYRIAGEEDSLGTLSVAFVYIHDRNLPYETVTDKMKQALEKVQHRAFPLQ